MLCYNVGCRHYQGPTKRTWMEKLWGVQNKQGGCKYPYCKMQMKGNKSIKR